MSDALPHSAANAAAGPDFAPEEKRVIFASSLGTVFEWYDFYLYATPVSYTHLTLPTILLV